MIDESLYLDAPLLEQSHFVSRQVITPFTHSQRRQGCPAGVTTALLATSEPSNMQSEKKMNDNEIGLVLGVAWKSKHFAYLRNTIVEAVCP